MSNDFGSYSWSSPSDVKRIMFDGFKDQESTVKEIGEVLSGLGAQLGLLLWKKQGLKHRLLGAKNTDDKDGAVEQISGEIRSIEHVIASLKPVKDFYSQHVTEQQGGLQKVLNL